MTTAPQQNIKTVVPDLRDIPLDQLADLGDTPLALYRARLKENGVPLSSFDARI